MHDEIAKRIIAVIKASRPSWTGPLDQLGIVSWGRDSGVPSAISTATLFFCILPTKLSSYSNIECHRNPSSVYSFALSPISKY